MADTKEAILTAALTLFAANGYEAVSVSQIAGRLGITKGALYRHYQNKRDIFDHILSRMEDMDLQQAKDGIVEKSDLGELIFQVFILAHFKTARKSLWFQLAIDYLEIFRCKNGHYKFPATMIQEKTDCFVMKGGHMNVGENKRKKEYREIISTYWMDRIIQVIDKD